MDLNHLNNDALSHENQELLQSLPRHHAWGVNLYLYKGFWLFSFLLNPTVLSEKNFHARDSDIILATLPKSGTTWLKSLVFAITKRVLYPVSDPNHPLNAAISHDLVPYIEYVYRESEIPDLSHIPSPRLFSTHHAYEVLPESVKAAKCRIIYLCRDQKDTFVSVWQFMNKVALQGTTEGDGQRGFTLEEAFELFCKGIVPHGPTWDHALEYWNASLQEPEKILFLRYGDLKGDIISQVKKIAEFLGFPFSASEESAGVIEELVKMCSFESLSNLKVNTSDGKRFLPYVDNTAFFRKGEMGDWVNYMTPSMAEKLDQITEQKLKGSALKFE